MTEARTLTRDDDAALPPDPSDKTGAAAPPRSPDRAGETIGRFRLLAKLGEGGMGVVYAAEDTRLRRKVALKLLSPGTIADPERRSRFLREARAAAAVVHPSIATVLEASEAGDEVFIIMELVEGETLRTLIRRRSGPFEATEATRLGLGIARGLGRAHTAGVVHRDIKPENVMVTPEGGVKILDFGLAKAADTSPAAANGPSVTELHTVEGRILGTPGYMAPEQARGLPCDARADVFSLGVVLYELLAGERPFRGESTIEVLIATSRDPPSPLRDRCPEATPALVALVERCLAKDPEARFADGLATLEALEAAQRIPPRAAPPEPTAPLPVLPKASSPRGLPRWAPMAAAALTGAVLAGVVVNRRSAAPGPLAEASPSASSAALSAAPSAVPSAAPPTTASVMGAAPSVSTPPRRPCRSTDADRGACSKDAVAWCDPAGKIVGCCGHGLIPIGKDGICGCAPGGTSVAEAIGHGCPTATETSMADIQRSRRAALDKAVACFEPFARERKKVSGGHFSATFSLTPEGVVIDAKVQKSTLPQADAQACALDALRATRFPPPRAEDVGQALGFGFEF